MDAIKLSNKIRLYLTSPKSIEFELINEIISKIDPIILHSNK